MTAPGVRGRFRGPMTSALIAMLCAVAPPKVASPPWNVVDVKPTLAAFYAEQLAQALRSEGLQVTTADDIGTLLGAERQRELMGCSNGSSCLVELANALGCDATLTVNLAKLGTAYRGLAKMMSSRDGTVLSSVKIDASSEAELADKLEAAAKVLAGPLKAGTSAPVEVVVARPAKAAPKFWWVPGAVGVVGVGAGALLLGLASGKYTELLTKGSAAEGAGFARDGATMQAAGWVAGSVGVAALVGSLAWLVFGSTEVQPQVTLAPGGLSLGLGGQF